MIIAFYKGRTRLFNKLVCWWLTGKYSHCEAVVSTRGSESLCASSSFLDGGVRYKYIELDPNHWDFVETDFITVDQVISWMQKHKDAKYDVLGLVGFIIRKTQGIRTMFFCSEVLADMAGFEDSWRFDPMILYRTLTRGK